jgi:hypothetical protein
MGRATGVTFALLAWMLGGTLVRATEASAAEPNEYEVKAAFIYNFAKFVEWPAVEWPAAVDAGGPSTPIKLCILGENPFGELLDQAVLGKQVNGRSFTVQAVSTASEAELCDIDFISASEASKLDALLPRLGKRPILTVSDLEGFADKGGIIGLKMQDKKVRFEVNMVAARHAGLKLSSQLLKVAVQVIGQLEESP